MHNYYIFITLSFLSASTSSFGSSLRSKTMCAHAVVGGASESTLSLRGTLSESTPLSDSRDNNKNNRF